MCAATKMMTMAWLRAFAFLLLSLLLARKVCTHVGGWLSYAWISRKWLVSEWQRATANGTKQHKLQVIVAGFPRTGTISLMHALDTLGFPCFHGSHLTKPSTANLFLKAFTTGNPKYWKKLLDGYAAIADFPGTSGYKQLLEIFPHAKVILNIRDANRWYDSTFETIGGIAHGRAIFKFITPWAAHCLQVALYNHFFNGKVNDKEICIKAYLQHIDEVKEQVAPQNLLVLDIEKEDGWCKLCEFLNVPIPESPFPKINNRKLLNNLLDRVARVYTTVLSIYVALVSCVLVYLVY